MTESALAGCVGHDVCQFVAERAEGGVAQDEDSVGRDAHAFRYHRCLEGRAVVLKGRAHGIVGLVDADRDGVGAALFMELRQPGGESGSRWEAGLTRSRE